MQLRIKWTDSDGDTFIAPIVLPNMVSYAILEDEEEVYNSCPTPGIPTTWPFDQQGQTVGIQFNIGHNIDNEK